MTRTRIATILLCLIVAVPAVAQERGVFVDPDSPAGKEYAIPLEEARRHGAGTAANAPGTGQPLFGEGIERATSRASAAGSGAAQQDAGRGQGQAQRGDGAGGGNGSSQANGGASEATRSEAIKAAASGSSDGLVTGAIVALILAAGLLAGIALRRVLRSE